MLKFAPVTTQNAVVATGNGTIVDVSGYQYIAIQVLGTFVATVTFEGSSDGGITWAVVAFFNSANANATSAAAPGIFSTYNVGYLSLRTRVTWTSGTSVTCIVSGIG